ncbi:unnamed protein product [Nezara viridula]|uniref:CHCH domain-containing protein n=1 Tax=Nezara viridula TaxID=85310 RepID=A0A9P0HJN9_NEZVI|nr:unnamed protein product [Nezara viridula]
MPRRGRSASPPPSRSVPMRAAPAARPPAPPPAPAPAQPPMVAPEQPSMFKQMAATAGGVAVGSAIGHTVGHGLTSMFSGGGSAPSEVAQPSVAAAPAMQQQGHAQGAAEPTGPCAWEIKQFLKCAADNDDISLCTGFNEAIRQCKEANR